MFIYAVDPVATQTTNATANTENDFLSVAPGTGRGVSMQSIYIHGKGASLTAISGITVRAKVWTTTKSAVGSGATVTPSPRDGTVQASKATAVAGAITPGTGGPAAQLTIGCGAAGPGGWVAPNADSLIGPLESAATKSIDLFNSSGTISLPMTASCEIVE